MSYKFASKSQVFSHEFDRVRMIERSSQEIVTDLIVGGERVGCRHPPFANAFM